MASPFHSTRLPFILGHGSLPGSLYEIFESQAKRGCDGCDDGEAGVGAVSLLDLRQRLLRDLSAARQFGPCQSTFPARLVQDDSHRAP